MTIATRAPVIMPSMATPKRISNQPMIRPAGDDTNAESPWPRTVAIPQLNESKMDSTVHVFSNSVMKIAATSTNPTIPSASVRKKRRSSEPPTRRTCQATRRISGLASTGIGSRAIADDRATGAACARCAADARRADVTRV